MRERILNDLKEAMKLQDKDRLSVIRMVKAAVQMEELNLKRELNDDEVIGIISKQIKTRKESIIEFEKGNRTDLIEQTQKEIEILMDYLPEQLTEEEVHQIVENAFNKVEPKSMADMGKLMAIITPSVKGKFDMGLISKMVKDRLGQ